MLLHIQLIVQCYATIDSLAKRHFNGICRWSYSDPFYKHTGYLYLRGTEINVRIYEIGNGKASYSLKKSKVNSNQTENFNQHIIACPPCRTCSTIGRESDC